MSSSAIRGDALGCSGGEASPPVSPSMEGVLPIRGVDGSTGEAISIDAAPSLRKVDDPFRADVVRWAALDVHSIMVEEDLKKLWEAYRIPADVELMLSKPNKRACFPMRGCTALHLNVFVNGIRLPLHPMFRRILRAHGLAPTQVAPNGWCQMVGAKEAVEEKRWGGGGEVVLFLSLKRVVDDPEPDLDVPSFYGIAKDTSQRKVIEDLSREENRMEVAAPDVVEVEDSSALEGEEPLKRKMKSGASGSGPSQPKKKAVELVDNYAVCAPQPFQRTLSVNPSGKVVLDSPPRVDPVSGGPKVGPFDSRKKLRELIGPPRSRISDDMLKNIPFFPSMGAQAVKKYFTPKWEEFASHGELEDVLEASLAAAVKGDESANESAGGVPDLHAEAQEARR
ncbi:Uncharacterized protein Adt_41259 [Abeliophyllum distichum]|uniref:Transposase (putative) gypsy type domain-containing protein n=1 Tax=Abeliophyllum distichum TaxID=126358 RepID=A0ABD1PNB5_9LAMI